MRKVINGLILIMTVGIIALCALLPQIHADIQDSVSESKVEYEDMKTVSFEKELNLIEKLFLLRDGLRIEVSEGNAVKSDGDITELAYHYLDFLRSSDILSSNRSYYDISMQPMFFFFSNAKTVSGTFWLVDLIFEDDKGLEKMSLWIDDETGNLLSIDYEADYPVYTQDQLEALLSVLYTYYLESSEIWDEEQTVRENIQSEPKETVSFTDEYVNMETKKLGDAMTFTIGDVIYGELSLNFYAYSNGFFISLS